MTYNSTILAETGLLAFWEMDDPSGTTMTDSGSGAHHGTYTGVTLGQASSLGDSTGKSIQTTGSATSYASAALDLSATNKVSVEFALKTSSWLNGDQLAMEFTTNYNNNSNGFIIDPNNPGPGFQAAYQDAGAAYSSLLIAQPAVGWHHFVVTMDKTAVSSKIHIYIDGVNQTGTPADNAGSTNFANDTLYMMSRAGASLWLAGYLDGVSVYNIPLSQAVVTAHYNAWVAPGGQVSHVTSIIANASTWTDQAGSSVSADLVTALDDNTATYIKSPGNPAGSGPITIHTGALSKPNAGNRNFIIGLQKSANTGTMDYTVECKKSGGASVQTFNKDGSAGATLVAALGNVASTGGTATCTVTNAIADADWANGFDWVVTPNKSA